MANQAQVTARANKRYGSFPDRRGRQHPVHLQIIRYDQISVSDPLAQYVRNPDL
jgi:hypothetical protein